MKKIGIICATAVAVSVLSPLTIALTIKNGKYTIHSENLKQRQLENKKAEDKEKRHFIWSTKHKRLLYEQELLNDLLKSLNDKNSHSWNTKEREKLAKEIKETKQKINDIKYEILDLYKEMEEIG